MATNRETRQLLNRPAGLGVDSELTSKSCEAVLGSYAGSMNVPGSPL